MAFPQGRTKAGALEREEELTGRGAAPLAANYGPRVDGGGRGMQPMATGGPMQPQAAATPEPPIQGALSGAAGGPAPTEIDPAKGVEVAEQSVEAVKTASDADKKAINTELEGMVGEGGLETAYKEAIERLGGEKTFDPKLKKEDWGLFLMDFGMRMMAASGAWNAQLGGAAGQAGAGALEGMMGRQSAEQGRVDEYNEELRESALTLAQDRMDRQDAQRDPENILWTDKGALNVRSGEYLREDPSDPTSPIVKPGMEPGAGNRQFASQIGAGAIKDSLLSGGLDDEAASSLANRMAYGGAPDPGKYYTEVAAAFDRQQEKAGITGKIPGTNIKWRDAGPQEKDRWVRDQVQQYMQFMTEGAGGGGALNGTQGRSGGRPAGWDRY